jgi:predicted dehydrogenase
MPHGGHPRTRIALVGLGVIGKAHVRALRESDRCELSAIVEPQAAAREAAREFAVPVHAALEALIEHDRPDGVVLATPNALHLPQALCCLRAGLPVLVEKPLAANVTEGEALVMAARETGVPLLVGHHRTHSPLLAQARRIIAEGALGRLVAVMGSAVFCKPDSYFREAPWRAEPGGGPILINMIHEVHNLRLLCGEVVAVQAFASRAVRGLPVEDTVAINLRFAGGALGSFMLSDTAACARSWEQTSGENPAYARAQDEDCYVIAGTHGCLHVPTLRFDRYAPGQERSWMQPFERTVLPAGRADPLVLQMEHFGAVVRGEARPLVSALDGLRNLQVVEAIAQAARSGRLVELPG